MESLKPIFILGPTGSGKSALAVRLAELLGDAEIVSADAYQVYRGMEILTAAPTAEELSRVPHHLVSCLSPAESQDAATHARRAQACLSEIAARGKRAIVTGGSGLYVKFISHGISPAPPSDPELRAKLSALPPEELVRRLQELDPEGAAMTPLQNPRYVCRNLEIVILGGRPLSHWRRNWEVEPAGPGFCVQRETADADARTERRARAMLRSGVLEELRALGDLHALSPTARKTLGLSELAAYLAAREPERRPLLEPCLPPEDAPGRELCVADPAAALALVTRRYAKRQRSWLRRETWLHPLPVAADDSLEALAERVAAQLAASGC